MLTQLKVWTALEKCDEKRERLINDQSNVQLDAAIGGHIAVRRVKLKELGARLVPGPKSTNRKKKCSNKNNMFSTFVHVLPHPFATRSNNTNVLPGLKTCQNYTPYFAFEAF